MAARTLLGLLLGVSIVALVVAGVRCLPTPARHVEWLRRDDAIIAQMKVADDAQDEIHQRDTTPPFTLYGDGTLIVASHGPSLSTTLLKTHVSNDAIQSLLDSFDSQGFFDYSYDQPRQSEPGQPTTYLYVNSKLAANAVSAYGLGSTPPDGDDWNEFRQLQKMSEQLGKMAADSGGTPFAYDSIVLVVRRHASAVLDPTPLTLPDQIDVSSVGPKSGVVELTVRGEGARALERILEPGKERLVLDSRGLFFDVAYRPLLPHEENFPEFEPAR